MIIPWRVDVPEERLPVANWFLIGIIICFFVWQIYQVNIYHTSIRSELNTTVGHQNDNNSGARMDLFEGLVLTGWTIRGLFGYMWLHGGLIHLIGNLLFLWIFGNAVCAKIGQVPFVLIYVALGVISGAIHLIFTGSPVIGASGAINGIVGMYLVFFPTNSIECLLLIFFPWIYWKTFEVSSYVIILMWFAYDILGAVMGDGQVAYFAHIGGFMTGFVIAAILLQFKFIKMTRYEKSLFQIFSDLRPKPDSNEPLFNRVLTREHSAFEEKPISEVLSADTAKTAKQTEKIDSSIFQSPNGKNDGFIRFYCNCGKRCKVPAQFAGKTGKCPQCGQKIKIPLC